MNDALMSRAHAFRLSFQLAQEAVNSVDGRFSMPREDVIRRVQRTLDDSEKAFHYAQRFVDLFAPAQPNTKPGQETIDAERESMLLAFDVVLDIVQSGADGLGYNGTKLKFIPYQSDDLLDDGVNGFRRKWHITQTFPWYENPWWMLKSAEKMAGSIRRVKAKTKEHVIERLFLKEGDAQ